MDSWKLRSAASTPNPYCSWGLGIRVFGDYGAKFPQVPYQAPNSTSLDKVARLVDVYESEDGTVECQFRVWGSGFRLHGFELRVLVYG